MKINIDKNLYLEEISTANSTPRMNLNSPSKNNNNNDYFLFENDILNKPKIKKSKSEQIA